MQKERNSLSSLLSWQPKPGFIVLTHSFYIDKIIEQLKDILWFFEKYIENGFKNALNFAKEIAFEMNIKPKFCIRHRKK